MAYRTVNVEVCLSEFSDEEIIDEVRDRELQGRALAHPGEPEKEVDARKMAGDVQGWLMTHRYDRAMTAMHQLLAALLPPQLGAAFDAMKDARYSDAICELDDFIQPSPAVAATSLPKRPAAEVLS